MASKDLTLLADQSNYRDTLQTYLKYMQQLPPQREWMKEKLGPKIQEIFEKKKEIRVLAVGTGTGEVDMDFLAEIISRGKAVHGDEYSVIYQVVEPNQAEVDYFRGVALKDERLSKVTFKWYVGFFDAFCEEFIKEGDATKLFDFAHYVRVFYHIDSVSALSMTYDNLLAKDGIVAVVGENEGAFWPKNMIFLSDHGMKHECFTCSGPVSDAYFLPGWIKQAEEKKWKYVTHTKKYNFVITSMFEPESKIGNYLIDFALHGKDCRNTVKKEILDDFFEFLTKNSHEEETDDDGIKKKQRCFPCELGAIMVFKQ